MTHNHRLVPPQVSDDRRPEWTRLIAEQRGLIGCEQLRSFAISKSAIKANIRAGRWVAILPRVYSTRTGPLDREAAIVAALLYAGPQAVLSHQTAAEIWRMRPVRPGPVHVTVPYQCSAISHPPLLVVHRSRAFRHLALDCDPPLASRVDTVLDIVTAEPTAREAQQSLTELVTSRRVAPAQVRLRMSERAPWRYRPEIEQALSRLETGVHSMLEELYAVDVERAHGLPEARRQVPVEVDGNTLFEDVTYDNSGIPLTVRLDGSTHLEPDVALRDRRRDNQAELSGRARLRYGWREIDGDPCTAAREVWQVMTRLGWQGPVLACPRCIPAQREPVNGRPLMASSQVRAREW